MAHDSVGEQLGVKNGPLDGGDRLVQILVRRFGAAGRHGLARVRQLRGIGGLIA
jgi:hypothetical protein